jgi:hypothetical protein
MNDNKIIIMPNWWNVFYVILNLLKHVIKEWNQRNILLQGKWNYFFEKPYGCKSRCFIIRELKEEVNNSLKGSVEGQSINNFSKHVWVINLKKIVGKNPYKQSNVEQQ